MNTGEAGRTPNNSIDMSRSAGATSMRGYRPQR